jgi:hypothetical protein
MSEREAERAAIVAELRKRIAEAWERECDPKAHRDVAVMYGHRRTALESAADYIEAGKHNQQEGNA